MRTTYLAFSILLIYAVSSCDQLGINPVIGDTNCLNQKDRDNYARLIANEKLSSTKLEAFKFTSSNVPEEKQQAIADELNTLNIDHDEYRKGFDCQYWGEDFDFLSLLSIDGTEIDKDFLDPIVYKGKFKITSEAILNAISQSEWLGKNIYVFPGISRIPWENASSTSKQDALKRINKAYNKIRKEHGIKDEVELFDPFNDYIFPHATFHQVYVSNFANAVIDPTNSEKQDLLTEMNKIEENIVSKFIKRAPDTI